MSRKRNTAAIEESSDITTTMQTARGYITPRPTITINTFTSGTNATFSLSGMQCVCIRGVGGGGGGGYGGTTNDVGGGGGGGGFAEVWLDLDYIRSSGQLHQLTYTVGAGGAGGTSANGDDGGTTTVKLGDTNGITLMTCYGGYGGQQGDYFAHGGTGGQASVPNGRGYAVNGHAAESGHDKGTTISYYQGANGGGSHIGSGGRGAVLLTGAPTYSDAQDGKRGGGGGGGKYGTVTPTTYRNGGAGGDGCVVVVGWSY